MLDILIWIILAVFFGVAIYAANEDFHLLEMIKSFFKVKS